MQGIGKNIRILRVQKNMTQDELAARLFVSRQTVSNYETSRSKPDIEMLLRISEVLDVDAQALLYGPPDTMARLAEKRRLIISCVALAAIAVLYEVLRRLNMLARASFMVGFVYPLVLLLRPILFLLIGWAAVQGIALLLKAKRPRMYWSKYAHRATWAVIIAYFLMVLPLCIWALFDLWQVWQYRLSGEDYSHISSFSMPLLSQFSAFILQHHNVLWAVFIPLGILLWITGGKPKAEQSATPSTDQTL